MMILFIKARKLFGLYKDTQNESEQRSTSGSILRIKYYHSKCYDQNLERFTVASLAAV
jgi:hypothetical protein